MFQSEVIDAAPAAAIETPAGSEISQQHKIWVDAATFTVVFCGRPCFLGNTNWFRLIQFLAAKSNRFVSHEDLIESVWGGQPVEDVTIRTTVRDLKRRLKRAGIPKLVEMILSQPGHYGLFTETNRVTLFPTQKPQRTHADTTAA